MLLGLCPCALVTFAPLSHTLCGSAPVAYLGGRELSKDFSDRVCRKCAVRIDRHGTVKTQPTNVPEVNPHSGQKNALYGWAPNKQD